MKKALIGFAVICMFFLASCSKERDCKCTTTINDEEFSVVTVHIEDGRCRDLNSETSVAGITTEVKCK